MNKLDIGPEPKGWKTLNWAKIQRSVFELQREIYLASKNGRSLELQNLREKLLRSSAAKLLAVRRVTQDNKGKATAGVDGVKLVPPEKRIALARSLAFPSKANPLRRV